MELQAAGPVKGPVIMPQRLNLLTDRRIRAIKEPGRYTDGGGLVLQCGPSGAKSWLFVWKRSGRRTVMGLGGIASVSLAEARAEGPGLPQSRGRGL